MNPREAKTVVPSSDLLLCFPSKPICSPARCSSHRRRNKPGAGKMSPLLLSKDKQISEPTSPKVTCAGQIKVRPRVTRRSWQADGGGTKNKKKHNWVASLGFKKDTNFHLLDRLRSTRCDFRYCFGWVLHTDEEDDKEEEDGEEENRAIEVETSRSMIFSKLFMVLPEKEEDSRLIGDAVVTGPPPANALLLMRCRSAPCREWLQRERDCGRKSKDLRSLMEEEKRMKRSEEDLVVKTETWIVGKNAGHFFRSRSWKR